MKTLSLLLTLSLALPYFAQASEHEHAGSVAPDTALSWLKNGNSRYLKKHLRRDGQSAIDRERLKGAQHPHTIILSCADSRVPPEIVFDQKLGEIFVVRAAGEALDFSVVGSLEYAVEHLGARLLLVMGHESCGAVRAALDTLKGGSAGSPDLDKLVADIHPRLKDKVSTKPSPLLKDEVWLNTRGVAADLVKRSEILRKKVEAGELKIAAAVYSLETGTVRFE